MADQRVEADVCVVGGGVVGKAAALVLAQAGFAVTVLAESASVAVAPKAWDVRVFALNHTAFALLDGIKVWQAMDQTRIAPVEAMRVYGDVSNALLDFDAYAAHQETLAWIVEESNLNCALSTALQFSPHLTVVQGRARQFAVDTQSAQITLDDGRVISAQLMVGADGAQSWLRGQCDIDLDYRAYRQQGVVCNFACEKPHHGVAHQWFAAEQGIIALLPLPGQQVSLVWSAPDDLAQRLLRESQGQIAERLAQFCADALGTLTPLQPELVRAFPLRLIKPHAIIAPRVALVGDAAHVVHPLAGHGMNLGFADVRDLVAVLKGKESFRDCGDARVLARYQRARKEDVLLMQWTTDGLAHLFGSPVEPLKLVRNIGLNAVQRLPFLKRALIQRALGARN